MVHKYEIFKKVKSMQFIPLTGNLRMQNNKISYKIKSALGFSVFQSIYFSGGRVHVGLAVLELTM